MLKYFKIPKTRLLPEIAQLAKCLSYEHENLSSVPIIPMLGAETGEEDALCLLFSQPSLIGEPYFQMREPFPKIKEEIK